MIRVKKGLIKVVESGVHIQRDLIRGHVRKGRSFQCL